MVELYKTACDFAPTPKVETPRRLQRAERKAKYATTTRRLTTEERMSEWIRHVLSRKDRLPWIGQPPRSAVNAYDTTEKLLVRADGTAYNLFESLPDESSYIEIGTQVWPRPAETAADKTA